MKGSRGLAGFNTAHETLQWPNSAQAWANASELAEDMAQLALVGFGLHQPCKRCYCCAGVFSHELNCQTKIKVPQYDGGACKALCWPVPGPGHPSDPCWKVASKSSGAPSSPGMLPSSTCSSLSNRDGSCIPSPCSSHK